MSGISRDKTLFEWGNVRTCKAKVALIRDERIKSNDHNTLIPLQIKTIRAGPTPELKKKDTKNLRRSDSLKRSSHT